MSQSKDFARPSTSQIVEKLFYQTTTPVFLMLLPEPIEKPQRGMPLDEVVVEQVFDNEVLVDYNQAFLDLHEFSENDVKSITPLVLSNGNRLQGLSKWRTLIQEGVLEISTREISTRGVEKFYKGEYQLLLDEQDRIIGHLGIEQVLTDYHDAIQGLQTQRNEAIKREQKLQSIFRYSEVGIWDWDIVTGSVQFNSEWFEMLGYQDRHNSVSVDRWVDIVHPKDYKLAQGIALEIESGNISTFEIEVRVKHKLGHWEHLSIIGRVFDRDKTGKPKRLVGTYTNVTKFKSFNEKISEQIDQISKTLDAGGFCVWELDFLNEKGFATNNWDDFLDGVFEDPNNHFTFNEWFTRIFPDDLHMVQDQLNSIKNNKRDQLNITYRIKNELGRYVWIQERGKVIERDTVGKANKLIGVTNDLSDLRRVEDRFQVALEGSHQGMWEWNLATDNIVCHEGWLKIHGYSAEEIARADFNSWKSIVHPEDYKRIHEQVLDHLSGKTDFFRLEYRKKHKNGHYIWILDRGKVVEFDAAGKPLLLIGTSINIDDQKKHQLDLEELVQMRDKFLDILSHDLRTPIANISGLVELLQTIINFKENKEASLYFDMLKKSTGHLTEMIENLLIWSRAKGGRIPFQPSCFKLFDLIKKAVEPYIEIGKAKGVTVTFESRKDKDMFLFIDMNMMMTVFANILTNAIKFTPSNGSVSISVKQDAKKVYITISDTGVGMSAEKIRTLFTPGRNTSTLGTDGEKGTGLGMLIVNDFMNYHSGNIEVKSKVGEGSTFTLSIPNKPCC